MSDWRSHAKICVLSGFDSGGRDTLDEPALGEKEERDNRHDHYG